MDFSLNDEQAAFQEAARAFAEGEMAPNAAEWDEKKIFPVDVLRAAGEMGFCGMYCPEEHGGMGLSRLDAAIILEELAAGCTSTAAFISIHNMAAWMVCTWGTGAVKEQWCGELTSGQKLASCASPNLAQVVTRGRCVPVLFSMVMSTSLTAAKCLFPVPVLPICWL